MSPNRHVILSALRTLSCILSGHPSNQQLFALANGLNALMQIEESWHGVCSVQAAKVLSNILNNATMVADFLYRRGLARIERLLAAKRDDLSGYLLGHVMNCAMYSSEKIALSPSLVFSSLGSHLGAADRIAAAVALPLRRGAERLSERRRAALAVHARALSAARSLGDVGIAAQHGSTEQLL